MGDLAILPDPTQRGAALEYIKRAWFVFPVHSIGDDGACSCGRACGRPGKHPRVPNGFKEATLDDEQVRAWWMQWPDANIGIDCGRSSLLIIDVDPRNNGEETLADLEVSFGRLPKTLTALTGGGGQHYYYDVAGVDARQRGRVLGQGVELKGDGGYVVAPPGTHISGRRYTWDFGHGSLEFPPQWILDLERRRNRQTEFVGEVLDGIMGAAFSAAGLLIKPIGPDRMSVKCPWAGDHSTGADGDTSTVVFGPSGKSRWGWFHCSHAHCLERLAGFSGVERMHEVLRHLPPEAAKIAASNVRGAERELKRVVRAEWERSVQWDSKGMSPVGNAGNLKLMMDNSEQWQGTLAFDESKDRLFWTKRPPEVVGLPPIEANAPVAESDWMHVSHWFLKERGMKCDKMVTQDVIVAVAKSNAHNSLSNYLESIQWDGVPRLSDWLITYCGARADDYTRRVGRAWMVSAMARALEPGSQVDYTLVLEGKQGLGKTSVFRILGGDWYLGSLPRIEDKDAQHVLSAAWIVEIQELSSMKGMRIEKVKAYLTERWDTYRPPYARDFVKRPRRCVFGASTNDGEYIEDKTGARRFWPVEITKIDLDSLSRDRDQLWAEAREAFLNKERWHFTGAELGLAEAVKDEQSSRQQGDPWEAPILTYAVRQAGHPFTTTDVLSQALNVELGRQTAHESRRVGGILRASGYVRQRRSKVPGEPREWVWVPHAGTGAPKQVPDVDPRVM